jgi:hypothetical protein
MDSATKDVLVVALIKPTTQPCGTRADTENQFQFEYLKHRSCCIPL